MKKGCLLNFFYVIPLMLSLLTQQTLSLSDSDEEFVPNQSRKRTSNTPHKRSNKRARKETCIEERQAQRQSQKFTLPVPIQTNTNFKAWINTLFASESQRLGGITPYNYIHYGEENEWEEKPVLGLFRHLQLAFLAYKDGLNGTRGATAKAQRYFEPVFSLWQSHGFETMKLTVDFLYKAFSKGWKDKQKSAPFLGDIKGKFGDLEKAHHQLEERYFKLIKESSVIIPKGEGIGLNDDDLNSMLEVLSILIDMPERYRLFKSYLQLFNRDQIWVRYACRFGMDFIIDCFRHTNPEELKTRKGNVRRIMRARILPHVGEELRHNFIFHLIRFRPAEYKIVQQNLSLFFPTGEITEEGDEVTVLQRNRKFENRIFETFNLLLALSSEDITTATQKLHELQEYLFDPTLDIEVRQERVIKVIRSSPLKVFYDLAQKCSKKRAYGEAIHFYNLALSQPGANAVDLHLQKAKCFRKAGQLPEARKSIEEAERSIHSETLPTLQLMCTLNRALIFEQQEDWDEAIGTALQASALYEITTFQPDSKTDRFLRKFKRELNGIYGNAYFAKGIKEKAKDYFRNNITNLKSDFSRTGKERLAQAYAKLCRIYFSEKNYEQVIQVTWDSGLTLQDICLQPEHALAHINLARAYEHMSQIDKALQYYEHALDMYSFRAPLINGEMRKEVEAKVARLRQQLGQP